MLAYGVAFTTVHHLSFLWNTSRFYSIWFPPAGVRFATLWLIGPKAAPLLAIAELIGLASVGVVNQSDFSQPLMAGSIVAPCLAYGLAIALARSIRFNSSSLRQSSLRLGLAAAIAPLFAFAASAPWHLIGNQPGFGRTASDILGEGSVFIVGDLLGILLLSPPILIVASLLREPKRLNFGSFAQWAGTAAFLSIGGLLVLAINLAGYGTRMMPLIVAVGAAGIMYGRTAAWSAAVVTSLTVLWMTAGPRINSDQFALHMQLIAITVMGLVAGAYADDQKRMREELRGRDSALLHAERLKTLRAMSVAVIHELSQPLSTLSIETKYLAKLSHSPESDAAELRNVSELIAQKTENLADMLRRLRTFGAAPGQEPVIVEVDKLVRDVVAIIAAEARGAGVRIEMRLKKDLAVIGQDVELQQALTNLLRNAISASPGGTVRLSAEENSGSVRIDVTNLPTPESPYRKGMGVGKLIVEAIAQMHGGTLYEHQSENGERTTSLFLPAASAVKSL